MRRIGDLGEAEGSRTALDRVRRAKDGVQFLGIRIADVQCKQQSLHLIQVLHRFSEERLVKLTQVDRHLVT